MSHTCAQWGVQMLFCFLYLFFFNDTAPTEIYTLSLHDALPISPVSYTGTRLGWSNSAAASASRMSRDRKSTRLNSSHVRISYAVFCLKKKKMNYKTSHCCSNSYTSS